MASSGRPLSSLAANTAGSIDWKIKMMRVVEIIMVAKIVKVLIVREMIIRMIKLESQKIHLCHHLGVAIDQVVTIQSRGQLHLGRAMITIMAMVYHDDDDDDNDDSDGDVFFNVELTL